VKVNKALQQKFEVDHFPHVPLAVAAILLMIILDLRELSI